MAFEILSYLTTFVALDSGQEEAFYSYQYQWFESDSFSRFPILPLKLLPAYRSLAP